MINSIRLQQFRNYLDGSFEFDSGVNIIVGPNASGKTNLLEAIYLLCTQETYRTSDSSYIQRETQWARIESDTDNQKRVLKLYGDGKPLQYQIDDKLYKKAVPQARIPVVLFEPDQLQSLVGQPEARRDFIDTLVGQLSPQFVQFKRQYKRVLAQRNALLKTGSRNNSDYFVWNVRLSELGGYLATARNEHLQKLQLLAPRHYQEFSGEKSSITLDYITKYPITNYSSALLQALEKSLPTDIIRGYTSAGPHRDDISIEIDGRNIQLFASRGEVRSVLLVIKTIEANYLYQHGGKKPVLLLDDVFSELDGRRRRALTETLKPYQTFITTTDADVVVKHFAQENRIISMG